MDSEVSVHGQLIPSLWACREAEHHGEEYVIEQSWHDGQEGERKDRQESPGTRHP
jgi:hypothetical protein